MTANIDIRALHETSTQGMYKALVFIGDEVCQGVTYVSARTGERVVKLSNGVESSEAVVAAFSALLDAPPAPEPTPTTVTASYAGETVSVQLTATEAEVDAMLDACEAALPAGDSVCVEVRGTQQDYDTFLVGQDDGNGHLPCPFGSDRIED